MVVDSSEYIRILDKGVIVRNGGDWFVQGYDARLHASFDDDSKATDRLPSGSIAGAKGDDHVYFSRLVSDVGVVIG